MLHHSISALITSLLLTQTVIIVAPAQANPRFPQTQATQAETPPAPPKDPQTGLVIVSAIELQRQSGQIPWGQPVLVRDPFEGDMVKIFDRQIISGSLNGQSPTPEERAVVSEWTPKTIKVYSTITTLQCGMNPQTLAGGGGLDPLGMIGSISSAAAYIPGAEMAGPAAGLLGSATGLLGGLFGGGSEPATTCQPVPMAKIPAQSLELKVGQTLVKLPKYNDGFAVTPEIAQILRVNPSGQAYLRASFDAVAMSPVTPAIPGMPAGMPGMSGMSQEITGGNEPIVAPIGSSTINAWPLIYRAN